MKKRGFAGLRHETVPIFGVFRRHPSDVYVAHTAKATMAANLNLVAPFSDGSIAATGGCPAHNDYGIMKKDAEAPPMTMLAVPQRYSSMQADAIDAQLLDSILRSIAAGPAASFFLSTFWLKACLNAWRGKADFRLLRLDGVEPAYALVGRKQLIRHGCLPVRVLALNQSAVAELDQPWIERNGFFGSPASRFDHDIERLLQALKDDPQWDELRLSGLMPAAAESALAAASREGLIGRIEFDQPIYWVDLDRVRTERHGDYLAALSSNTRQQLRRSRRAVEQELGALSLEPAASTAQALEWFELTAPMHRARWGQSSETHGSSGFDNPEFIRFHQLLIESSMPEESIQYLRLTAGGSVLAYLYNFVLDGHVYFYLSGIDYSI